MNETIVIETVNIDNEVYIALFVLFFLFPFMALLILVITGKESLRNGKDT
ncbi:hypothetical protein [Lysinibacillus sp. FSL K6-0102]